MHVAIMANGIGIFHHLIKKYLRLKTLKNIEIPTKFTCFYKKTCHFLSSNQAFYWIPVNQYLLSKMSFSKEVNM